MVFMHVVANGILYHFREKRKTFEEKKNVLNQTSERHVQYYMYTYRVV